MAPNRNELPAHGNAPQADNPNSARSGRPTAPKMVTKAFSLTADDVMTIETVRSEEGFTSDSGALRRLIRDGKRYIDASKRGSDSAPTG